ncbi:hypothetical protein LOK49_LG02G03022 [Camellia lanceoleosa]|uniref:Uncharacterized protein n=1 Tax=Camellia lanceoleosa TaxID=1840588 RepID=A0ACC0ISB2_9ERIC|nr:hypothetical protein LOK49_LG02G03022 [Camellia lanceoleosa]
MLSICNRCRLGPNVNMGAIVERKQGFVSHRLYKENGGKKSVIYMQFE